MPNTQSSKGNPASHRMSNAHLKEARSRRWRNGQLRKTARIKAQQLCEAANVYMRLLPANGLAEMTARAEAGEKLTVIAKDFGTNEFTVARMLKYGKLTPWQVAEANRAFRRRESKNSKNKPVPAA